MEVRGLLVKRTVNACLQTWHSMTRFFGGGGVDYLFAHLGLIYLRCVELFVHAGNIFPTMRKTIVFFLHGML